MKFTTLIPVRFNDGKPVPNRQLRRFVHDLAIEFKGCSDEGITKGQWVDPADSVHYHDKCMRVSVVCDRVMLDEARAAVVRIGQTLKQRAMYFEVRDYDGVQIIEIPPARH
ncbi:MAG TPA: hypothetical protein VGI40_14090 [Pirellulaceae bacterium]|jgi:hypothetical protein